VTVWLEQEQGMTQELDTLLPDLDTTQALDTVQELGTVQALDKL
jgi:hypothetical protein